MVSHRRSRFYSPKLLSLTHRSTHRLLLSLNSLRIRGSRTHVSSELSQFAYNFEANALITKHMPLRPFHSTWDSSTAPATTTASFFPAVDPLASAVHLFFTTLFARHPAPYRPFHFVMPQFHYSRFILPCLTPSSYEGTNAVY